MIIYKNNEYHIDFSENQFMINKGSETILSSEIDGKYSVTDNIEQAIKRGSEIIEELKKFEIERNET